MAISRICCWPPDSVPAGSRRLLASIGKRVRSASMSSRTRASRRKYAPISRFSSTLIAGKLQRPCGT
jgi:hypothetical protein